ncbi:MAG: excinuclease ABC subunit UvrA [Firmicutes bacterium]|nr:excinuclease ABC subunit UvrA [Bacillota bacterium]
MGHDHIVIKGARAHNLKNIDVTIPRDCLVVLTGLSGSGKSSLAFDTLYAEGQRRYVESLSAYARQFLGQMDKPDVDSIEGLSPAISIDQKTTSRNPRSTVGTVTEIYDYLRLLFARVGKPFCPRCGTPISSQTIDQMVDHVLSLPERTRLQILAPIVAGKKGEHAKVFEDLAKAGYVRVRVDGQMRELAEEIALEKNKKHSIAAVVDRIVVKEDVRARLADSLETALALTGGTAIVDVIEQREILFSSNLACPKCGHSVDELSPRMFSFNSPFGACEACAGLGAKLEVDLDLVIPDRELTIAEGALVPWAGTTSTYYPQLLAAACRQLGVPLDRSIAQIEANLLQNVLYGMPQEKVQFTYENDFGQVKQAEVVFEGIVPNLERRYRDTVSDYIREFIEGFMSSRPCPACKGKRLRPESLSVRVGDKSISDVTDMSITQAIEFFAQLTLSDKDAQIAHLILREIDARLGFLRDVGLNYLTLARAAGSLSGGEAQRIRLATQIGSSLVGVMYILDEPSIGLHQRDNERLLRTLTHMRDLGNTLIVVEHDEDTMFAADQIIDMGPGAGEHGGRVVAQGNVQEIMAHPDSLTGQFLSGRRFIPVPDTRRQMTDRRIVIAGAAENNLKSVTVAFPVGLFTCVTGVSGSGKSTLVNEILHKTLAEKLNRARVRPGRHKSVQGLEYLDKVIDIDQSPIGRTPRSNPATYTGLFDEIRDVYATTNEAKIRGYKKGRFSFNVRGGRCEACRGDGIIKIEMHFLPDVYVPCEVCKGKRYNRETMEVHYKGRSIAEVLDMTVDEACVFFENVPRLCRKLQTLADVGLGYMRLGQPATTLSGGEAQRVKLASELHRRSTGRTLYILDEPTTGLHVADIERLLIVLQRLVDAGDTVVVIEHNLDVIKTADYLIDLGPEGGDQGGRIVVTGTPEQVAAAKGSYTGQFLGPVLARDMERAARLESVLS